MPIAVEVVSKERFAQWVAAKRQENGIAAPTAAAAAALTTGTVAGAEISSNAARNETAEAATGVTPVIPTAAALVATK